MRLAIAVAMAAALGACGGTGDVQEERVSLDDGMVDVCGNEPGMPECRDYNGETYSQELEYTTTETTKQDNQEMAKEAEHIRSEDPRQLEETIKGMEEHPQYQ